MATQWGKTPLQKLTSFRARRWFPTAFIKFAARVASNYAGRSELSGGGIITDGGSLSLTTLHLILTGDITGVMAGRVFSVDEETTQLNYLTTTGSVGAAIWANGEAEADRSITLAAGSGSAATIAYVTLIVTNSDGAGDADETDSPTCLIVAVIACDPDSAAAAEDYTDASSFLTSQQISGALAASDEHDGVTGWTHLAEVAWNCGGDGAIDASDITMNRNNVVSES